MIAFLNGFLPMVRTALVLMCFVFLLACTDSATNDSAQPTEAEKNDVVKKDQSMDASKENAKERALDRISTELAKDKSFVEGLDSSHSSQHASSEYIRSVHYFSDAWPITFWQEFEMSEVDAELAQIKADGFNTVMLIIPWTGFETGFKQAKTQSDARLYARLSDLMVKIAKQDFNVILRVGYAFDFTPGLDISRNELCRAVFTDDSYQDKWLNYLQKLKATLKPFNERIVSVMVSWEDYWCAHLRFPYFSLAERTALAAEMGYQDWLKANHETYPEIAQIYAPDFNKLAVPEASAADYLPYLRFIDVEFDARLLQPAKQVFPQAAMEVRVDKMPVKRGDDIDWVAHDMYLHDTNLKGTYWAPFWGASNQGEKLTLEQGLKNFEYFMRMVSDQGNNTNHILEQFNFDDNTPHYPNHAVFQKQAVVPFLEAAAPLLKQYAKGYGLWAYRDYTDNALYNASFELDTDGWQVKGMVEAIEQVESSLLKMSAGASIAQRYVPARRHTLPETYSAFQFCLFSQQDGEIELLVDGKSMQKLKLTAGKSCRSLPVEPLDGEQPITLSLRAITDVVIDDLSLFGFVQSLGVYQHTGEAGPYLPAVRALNAYLAGSESADKQ